MRFFASFYKSLSNFSWLKEKKQYSGGWSYFVLLVFFLSGLSAIFIFFSALNLVNFLQNQINQAPEFKLELKDGVLSAANIAQPFKYTVAEDNTQLIVDTGNTANIQNYAGAGQNVVLVAKDKAVMYNAKSGQTKEESFKELPNFTLDKATVLKTLGFLNSTQGRAIFITGFMVAQLLVLFIMYLANILFCSFLIYLLAKKRLGVTFKEVFNIGLFAITLPAVLQLVFTYTLGWQILTVALFVYLYIIVLKNNKKETVTAV